MSELPTGWAQTKLSEITSKIGSGSTPRGGSKSYKQNGIPLVRSMNVHFDGFHPAGLAYIDDEQAKQLANVEVKAGDVLLNITGASIGRVTTAPQCLCGARVNQHVSIIRLLPEIETNYVRYFLASPEMQRLIQEENYGVTRQALTKGIIEDIDVPLPPLAEQRRIVARLDSLFARTRRARAELAHIPVLVEHYKQAILAAAFRGELTAQTTYQSEDVDHQVTPMWSTPASWYWRHVEQVGDVSLGRQRSPKNHQGPHMRPYIRAANITWAGLDLTDVKTMNFDADDFSRFALCDGDVLLNEGSGSAKEVGKPAIWRGEIKDCCFQNTVLRVQPRECSSEFLYWYFMHCAISGQFAKTTQGINIFHIGKAGLANFPIPYPPPNEQSAIVRCIESSFAWLDKLTAEHARAAHLLPKFEQALLAKAFQGELVPQHPNDEPAAVLLEHIRAARAGQSQGKGKSRQLSLSI